MECCDSSVTFVLPVLTQLDREDVQMLTIYDNPSTIQAMQAGANLGIAAANTNRTSLQALDVLLDHFINDTPIPATYPNDEFEVTVIDTTTGEPVYPFEPQLENYKQKWASEYTLP